MTGIHVDIWTNEERRKERAERELSELSESVLSQNKRMEP